MHGARYGGATGDSANMLWVTEDDASSATGSSSSSGSFPFAGSGSGSDSDSGAGTSVDPASSLAPWSDPEELALGQLLQRQGEADNSMWMSVPETGWDEGGAAQQWDTSEPLGHDSSSDSESYYEYDYESEDSGSGTESGSALESSPLEDAFVLPPQLGDGGGTHTDYSSYDSDSESYSSSSRYSADTYSSDTAHTVAGSEPDSSPASSAASGPAAAHVEWQHGGIMPRGLWGAESAPQGFRPAALAIPPQPHPQNPQYPHYSQGYGYSTQEPLARHAPPAAALAANAAAALGGVAAASASAAPPQLYLPPAPREWESQASQSAAYPAAAAAAAAAAADAATNDSATGIEGWPVGSAGDTSCSVSVIMKTLITAVHSTNRVQRSTVEVWRAAEALLREGEYQFQNRPDNAEGSSGVSFIYFVLFLYWSFGFYVVFVLFLCRCIGMAEPSAGSIASTLTSGKTAAGRKARRFGEETTVEGMTTFGAATGVS